MQSNTSKKRTPNPQLSANWFSKVTFRYLNSIISKGYRQRLEADDVFEVLEKNSTRHLGNRLGREWVKELEKATELRPPNFGKVLITTFKWELLLGVFLTIVSELFRILPAVLLGPYLATFSESPSDDVSRNSYLYATGITLAFLCVTFVFPNLLIVNEEAGLNIRSAVTSLIYTKALRLNLAASSQTTSGHIINLISTDTQKLLVMPRYLSFLIVAPIEIAALTVILWFHLGPSCFIATAFIILLIILQLIFGRKFGALRKKVVQFTDERVKVMSEMISGMRVLKMYTWEEPFTKLVNKLRRNEIKQIQRAMDLRSFNATLHLSMVYLIALVTFGAYVSLDNTLKVSTVFSVIALVNVCNLIFAGVVPTGIQDVMESRTSAKRIQKFLTLDEMVSPNYKRITDSQVDHASTYSGDDTFIRLEHVTARWDKTYAQPTLSDISLLVDRNNPMLVVAGPVGSGKSSLLTMILGDLPPDTGTAVIQGSIGYVSQQSWVFSGTVRQNITFGLPFDKMKYEAVVLSCALAQDIKRFPDQDNTLVGERGVALSGGQKARISLARAVYQDCDLYLLDDPLSAVDPKVGKYLFEKCICGILKYKPKILVTHQVQYLSAGTEILCMNEGKAVAQGNYSEIKDRGFDVESLLFQDETSEKDWDHDSAIDTEEVRLQHRRKSRFGRERTFSGTSQDVDQKPIESRARALTTSSQTVNNPSYVVDECDFYAKEYATSDVAEIQEEERASGVISYKLYFEYFKNGAPTVVLFLILFLSIVAQVGTLMSDLWLAKWAEGDEREAKKTANETIIITFFIENDRMANLKIFAALSLGSFLLGLIRSFSVYRILLNASKNLHNKMLAAVIKAPIYFFDTNPVGRVLNRFSKDIFFMDEELVWATYDFGKYLILLCTIIIVNVVNFPYILIAVLPLLVIFLFVRRYYLTSSRELKRIEGISRSPLFSHVSATLQGLTTIRALGKENEMIEDFNSAQDFHSVGWFLFIATSRWFAFRLDMIVTVLVGIAVFTPVVIREFTSVNSAITGFSVLYILNLSGTFQYCVRQGALVENMMTSVERVLEYSKIEGEPDNPTDADLTSIWPKYGVITGEGVSFSYHHTMPFVLKNLFFCIRSKEKVGIIGRTGAGKSSLIAMFLRMAKTTGTIRIDGTAISALSLNDLRSRISVIPQDPVLFSGTLRKNVDPFGEFHDADIWDALEEVQLKDAVMELPQGLSTEISEAGLNISVGQRQLLCLARAILRKTKILFIDEATANVDADTDSLIQETIREKFKDCTVLTIAHRLNTIMDSDRVLVLQDGRIMEFDEPYELLKRPESLFKHFVDQTGKTEANRLQMMAEVACKLRKMIAEQERARSPLQDGWKKIKIKKGDTANVWD